jgi:hypothetical protein
MTAFAAIVRENFKLNPRGIIETLRPAAADL